MFDVCIIGAGGVVGCAIARELAERKVSVVALEKHPAACRETSGLNSRVIHSGFHESPGTLKAQLARKGSRLMIRYAEERGVKLLRTGMLIAVPYGSIQAGLWKEAGGLWNLWRQGRRQKIPFRFIFTAGGVRKIAPVRALGGIFIPSVCVVDLEQLVASLERDAVSAGAQFVYNSEVTEIAVDGETYAIRTSNGEFRARMLVNSAGLRAHEISVMARGPNYNVEFLRGDYYELAGGIERWKIRTLVYPAMPPKSPSKGMHFGPRTDGRLYVGPSATAPSKPALKEMFLAAARKFLPDVQDKDLQWAYAGVRPKHGSDFSISIDRERPMLVNLIGIDSPGLSASMAIAQHVRHLMEHEN